MLDDTLSSDNFGVHAYYAVSDIFLRFFAMANFVKPIKHKFHAQRVECDGLNFQSKKEKNHYEKLKQLQQQQEVLFFLFQVPLHLPGPIRYVCDFLVFWADGTVSFEDVKGYRTDLYKAKKKIVESIYPIEIIER